jgi:murein DD-endopeptidase MepM/ murein hydrolase activator NlpD
MTGMFDVDRRVSHVRSYDPNTVKPDFESNGVPPWAYDQHDGVDYCFPVGTQIVAAAPGTVKVIEFEAGGAGNLLVIHHPYDGKQTLYAHLSEILVSTGERVARGQPVALSGNSGVSGEPHLHFRLATWETPPDPIDPYRDLTDPESVSYWTVANNPQYPRTGQ